MNKRAISCDANVIRALLHAKYDDTRRYAVAEEVGNKTGYQQRRLDMVVADVYESNGYAIEGIEIKVSKADLRRELQDSTKHNIFFSDLDYYSLAAPADIIDKDIIPKHWGIYAARQSEDGGWSLRTIRKPLSLHDEGISKIDKEFFACLARALSCQSPTKSQITAAERRGEVKGAKKERQKSSFTVRKAEQNIERLEELERLYAKCSLWGDGSADEGIRKFEAFRQMRDRQSIRNSLEYVAEQVSRSIEMLDVMLACEAEGDEVEVSEPVRFSDLYGILKEDGK